MIYKTLKKVSDYCQLLDKRTYPATRTTRGITFTNNGDGTITANGTATGGAQYQLVMRPFISCKDNHKYLVKGSPSGGGYGSYRITTTVSEDDTYVSGFSDSGSGNISNALLGSYAINVLIDIYKGTTVSNLVFKPQLFDLTEMYGVGNEPTTVDEFKADFPNDLYDYKPYCFVPSYKNCLIHPIPITSGNLIDFPYASAYDTRQGMTFSQVDTYKVHASGVNNTPTAGVVFDFINGKTLSAGTYTIKYYTEGTVTTDLYFRGRKGSYYGASLFPEVHSKSTFTLTEDTAVYIAFGFVGGVNPRYTGETIDLTVWCRLERGTDVTDYISSYKKSLICTTKNLFDKSLTTIPNDIANGKLIETTKNGWIVQGNIATDRPVGTAYWANGWFSPGSYNRSYATIAKGMYLKSGDVVTVSAYYTLLENNITDVIGIYLYGTKSVTSQLRFPSGVGVKTRISRTLKIADGQDGLYNPVFTLNSSKILIEDIQIEYGTTLTEYHPYGYL